MLNTLTLSTLLTAAALPAGAVTPQAKAYAVAQGMVGRQAVAALERQGLLATAQTPERLLAVSWGLLERTEKDAPRLVEFFAAVDELRKGREPADPADSFADLRARQEGGLISEAVRNALAAAGRRADAVRALGDKRAHLSKSGSLFRTPWGRTLARRTHADLGGSSADDAAPDFFRDILAAPAAPPAAAAHLKAWAAAAGVEGMDAEIEASLAAGKASAALTELLARYLRDQALLEQAEAASARLAQADRGTAKALFMDARTAAAALAANPGLAAKLREVLAESPDAPSAHLTSHEVHVRGTTAPPLEPGDKAVFSAAYWVDGLPQGRSADVAEVLLLEDPERGLSVISRTSHSRSNGGPYTVSIEADIPRSGRLPYRLLLDADGAAPVDLAKEVEASDSLDRLRGAAAEAQWLGLSCRFDDAEKAWNGLVESAAASSKKAHAALAADARAALKTLAVWKGRKKELDESLDGARLFATKENCDYRPDRAERALKLLADLPAGCDRALSRGSAASEAVGAADRAAARGAAADAPRVGSELAALAAVTDSRRSLQQAFRAGAARAKDKEASCKSTEAAALYASALALLDSDPEARCGEFEKEHAAIRLTDLPKAAAGKDLADAAEAELSNARRHLAGAGARAALNILLPLSTALRALPDQRCWSGFLARTDELVGAAGIALGPQGSALKPLPPDPSGPALAEARSDWDERQSRLRAERGAADSVQAPRAAGGEE